MAAGRRAGPALAFLASARGFQQGDAVPVIACTSTAANVTCIIGGIVVFGDALAGRVLLFDSSSPRSRSSPPAALRDAAPGTAAAPAAAAGVVRAPRVGGYSRRRGAGGASDGGGRHRRRLVAEIEAELDALVDRIGERIREEIPDFRRLPADRSPARSAATSAAR